MISLLIEGFDWLMLNKTIFGRRQTLADYSTQLIFLPQNISGLRMQAEMNHNMLSYLYFKNYCVD